MKKLIVVVIFIFVFLTAPSKAAHAQTLPADCQVYNHLVAQFGIEHMFLWASSSLPDPTAPPTMICCNPFAVSWGQSCIAPRAGSPNIPDFANDTCLECNRGNTPQGGSSPIDLATGNTYVTQSDISIPGLGGGLSLSRTWNSLLPTWQRSYPFMFGTGWRSTFEEKLIYVSGDGFLKYLRSDGSVWSFAPISLGATSTYKTVAPADDTTTTLMNGPTVWTLTSKSGEKRLFDSTTGNLVSIVDRNGNTTALTYDSAGRLATVTDPASRHLYFHYPDNVTTLVSSVTSDVGISISYTFDAQGRLSYFTKPDNTSISFEYNGQSLITAVKDFEGKVLEAHTYDVLGRGVTASRANGVRGITVTYP